MTTRGQILLKKLYERDGAASGIEFTPDKLQFMRLGEIGDNFSVNVTQLVAEGDTVVGLGTYSWNRTGSGEPAEVKIAHVWTLDSGKVTRFQQHVDTAKERYLIA
jgi:ketosteroid isomerase-like protein